MTKENSQDIEIKLKEKDEEDSNESSDLKTQMNILNRKTQKTRILEKPMWTMNLLITRKLPWMKPALHLTTLMR